MLSQGLDVEQLVSLRNARIARIASGKHDCSQAKPSNWTASPAYGRTPTGPKSARDAPTPNISIDPPTASRPRLGIADDIVRLRVPSELAKTACPSRARSMCSS